MTKCENGNPVALAHFHISLISPFPHYHTHTFSHYIRPIVSALFLSLRHSCPTLRASFHFARRFRGGLAGHAKRCGVSQSGTDPRVPHQRWSVPVFIRFVKYCTISHCRITSEVASPCSHPIREILHYFTLQNHVRGGQSLFSSDS